MTDTEKKLKIAVVGTRGIPATYGGVERHCEELYTRLVNLGHEVTIYTRSYYINKDKTDYNGVKLKGISTPDIKGFAAFLHSMVSAIYASFSDADIIHFHSQGPSLFTIFPWFLAPKKKVGFTCHGIDWQRDKWNIIGKTVIKMGEFASAKFTHFKIGVSQYLVDYYKEKYNVQLKKIFNGVNIPEKTYLSIENNKWNLEPDRYLIFVGRLVPEKGIDILIDAFKQVDTELKLAIVGDSAGTDDYVKNLHKLAKGDERIIFTSFVYGDELKALYSNAMAYVSTSKLEGLPLTVLEAMSYSLPVLLSDIESHLEVVNIKDTSGISFKVNSVESAKNAISIFLSYTEDQISQMKLSARKTVENDFSWDIAAKETEKVYYY